MIKNDLLPVSRQDPDKELQEIIRSLSSSKDNTPEEKDFFREWIDVKIVKKGTLLLREGQISNISYHLYKGCIREYYLKDEEEKTVAFYTTGDSVTADTVTGDNNTMNRVASGVNWECVCDSIVSVYPVEVEKEMYRRFPRLESMCRIETEKQYLNYKNAMNRYLSSSPAERYENLVKTRPEIFQLVPLYHIASYLGVKPESLSRIRNRLRSSS